jgi:predicted O-methyltransferase YrrM
VDAARLREAYASSFAGLFAARVRWLESPPAVIPTFVTREEAIARIHQLGPFEPRNFIEFDDRVVVPLVGGGAHHWQLADAGAVRFEVHPNRPAAMGAASGYRALLERMHEHLRPRTYVEIGVRRGLSLGAALPGTRIVGIDPDPEIADPAVADVASIFEETSDDFFRDHDLRLELDRLPVDLAFIDGMHLFEFALRDFANLERYAQPESVILVHDVLPESPEMATREFKGMGWCGDVWKLVPGLRDVRPDLRVAVIDTDPTGLALVTGLDPFSTALRDRHDELVERYVPRAFERLESVDDDWEAVKGLLRA